MGARKYVEKAEVTINGQRVLIYGYPTGAIRVAIRGHMSVDKLYNSDTPGPKHERGPAPDHREPVRRLTRPVGAGR